MHISKCLQSKHIMGFCSNLATLMRQKDPKKVEQIFEAALQLVSQEGLSGLKMQKLARQAGMAAGTLYVYFEDKEALLLAMDLYYRRWLVVESERLVAADDAFEERFRKTWFNYLRLLQRRPKIMVFMDQFQMAGMGAKSTSGADAFEFLSPFSQLIAEGQTMGLISQGPPRVHLALLTAAAHKWVLWAQQEWLPPTTDFMHLAWELSWKAIKR